jgi:hypothetical protein
VLAELGLEVDLDWLSDFLNSIQVTWRDWAAVLDA